MTLHVQHDRPSEEVDAVSPSMKVQEAPAPKAAEAPARAERRVPQPFAGTRSADSAGELMRAPAPAAALPAPVAQAEQRSDVGAASAGMRAQRDEQRSRAQVARAVAPSAEDELERIAKLRAAGRHEDADKALAEFRKRYPDYRFSDEMKAKVERR